MKTIKYQYAKDKNDKLVHISEITIANKEKAEFYCVSCGKELIARLGNIKVHHFAHKKDVTCSCETYLHSLGKKLFFDSYTDCLINKKPFFIELYEQSFCNHYEKEFGIKCKIENELIKYDLTKYCQDISLEKRVDSFIADILLTSKDKKEELIIEIAVTHLSTEEKLNSKYRIIELKLEKEEDLEPIKKRLLSISDSRIMFRNFKIKENNCSFCNGACKKEYYLLTLHKDGKVLLAGIKNLEQIKHKLQSEKEKIIEYKILDDIYRNEAGTYRKGVASFANDNFKVRNCFICKYHAEAGHDIYDDRNTENKPIFCKTYKFLRIPVKLPTFSGSKYPPKK